MCSWYPSHTPRSPSITEGAKLDSSIALEKVLSGRGGGEHSSGVAWSAAQVCVLDDIAGANPS